MYENWANSYDSCVREVATLFWQRGILKELNTPSQIKVLDLGAGTGVGASLLKKLGSYEVHSLDQSAEMLSQAVDSDQVIHLDIADISQLSGDYELIVAGFNSMNYLSFEVLQELFTWVSQHLKAGGQMIFDYSSPYLIRWNHQVRFDFTTHQLLNEEGHVLDDFSDRYSLEKNNPHQNHQLLWNHEFESETERCKTTIQYINIQEQTVVWEEVHYQYAFNCYQMEHVIFESGLKIEKIRDLHGQHFTPSTYTHIYLIG